MEGELEWKTPVVAIWCSGFLGLCSDGRNAVRLAATASIEIGLFGPLRTGWDSVANG
jgi:hypothetical protein